MTGSMDTNSANQLKPDPALPGFIVKTLTETYFNKWGKNPKIQCALKEASIVVYFRLSKGYRQ